MFFLTEKNKKDEGFVLIEMMVSVALFAIVMTVGMGSLLGMIASNKKSQSLKVIVNNINLSMEEISKDLRMGYLYNCGSTDGGDCVGGSSSIYFMSKKGLLTKYFLEDNAIKKHIENDTPYKITATDAVIDNLQFYVIGSLKGNGLQPKVVILIKGHKGERVKDKLVFELQTTVTQRILDF